MEDRRLVAVSRLFYEQQLSKTQIGERLQMSITHVNRLLKEAVRRKIVEISIKAPNSEDLEQQLKEQFGLKDAIVIAMPEEGEYLRTELGQAGADYFEKHVGDGSKVGIGSGRTIFEFCIALKEKPRKVDFSPIAVFAQRDLLVKGIDSNTAVNIAWFKGRPEAKASRVELFFPNEDASSVEKLTQKLKRNAVVERFADHIDDLDFYFFSCSQLRKDSQLVEIAETCGKGIKDLQRSGVIGDFLFSTIDKEGKYVPNCIQKRCLYIDLKSLKRASASKQRSVVLMAGGREKFPVIRAGLVAGLFNVLITDVGTAQSLLASKH